jgi:ATPase family associated with various cellular activities (AAA)
MSNELQKAADAKKHNWDKLNPEIQYEGRNITLPNDPGKMPLDKAITALMRKQQDEEQTFAVHEVIDAYPHDGAVAFVKAMTKLYGWASPQTVMTFFGPKPPQMLSIKTGPGIDDVVQCPLGQFVLPGVDAPVNTMFWNNENGIPCFLIHAQVKKKHRHLVLELANEARRIIREESIYRGRPIRLRMDSDGEPNFNIAPEFIDVTDTSEASVLFDDNIMEQINTSILVPMKQTAMCRKLNIPLKRGVLLEGPFGTGKSLTARVTAAVAQQNGWTFVLLDNVRGLRTALEFANRYAPAVVFAEDIDRIASERDEDMNDLINTIDGVVSKRSEIMTILTTNFVDKLNPVILRPGRLDAVISLRAPNASTVEKLLHLYGAGLVPVDADLTAAGEALAGQIPASIRECIERAKLSMIGRGAEALSGSDLVTAAELMKNHLALLNRKVAEITPAEKLADGLRQVLANVEVNMEDTDTVVNYVQSLRGQAARTHSKVLQIHEKVGA